MKFETMKPDSAPVKDDVVIHLSGAEAIELYKSLSRALGGYSMSSTSKESVISKIHEQLYLGRYDG